MHLTILPCIAFQGEEDLRLISAGFEETATGEHRLSPRALEFSRGCKS